ncbi:AAA family ATPase [Butyrivibrio sp. AE3004]|uniref:AAA family ATPase n=1 Tax=Butyrivibrio sp. AE3004 TaxID=1506994 RepID=UPI00068E7498|nr:AAA family ATPase [Butyrivibrio sp. AE3004]
MGIYLNPGKSSYEEAVNSEIYVDKSELIAYLNTVVKTKQKYVSVSRPRRFGKTMAADMICAYYDREADSRDLFEKVQLSKNSAASGKDRWDEYLGSFDVIRIVMTKFFKKTNSVDEGLEKMQRLVSRELMKKYPDADYFDEKDLIQTIEDAYAENKWQLVIVIDEWDAVFREFPEDKNGQITYLDFLRDLIKDKSYIALAYMTGILPIKKYGKHSALNMFTEYSMTYV